MENKNRIICKALRYLREYKKSHTEKEYLKYINSILRGKKIIPIETNRDISHDMMEFLSKDQNLQFCFELENKSTAEIHDFVYNSKKTAKKVGIASTLAVAGATAIIGAKIREATSAAADDKKESKKIVKEMDEYDEYEEALQQLGVKIEEPVESKSKDTLGHDYGDDRIINKEALGHDYGYDRIINKETLGHDYGLDKIIEREEKKQEVLYDFCECKSIKDVLKRQKELEGLNLTDEDKVYTKCPLSPEIQWFIYEQSIRNNIPPDFTFSIIGVESRGEYDTNGKQTYNRSNNSYDLGLTQQNSISRLPEFQKKYGLTYDEAYNYLKNNEYLNIVSAFLYYDEIKSHFNNFNAHEFAGCYNGWLNWKGKKYSIEYVDLFDNYYGHQFTKLHNVPSNGKSK